MSSEHQPNVADGGVGARVLRKEDERHLFGRGRFVADLTMPGLQEVAFLRSPLAHARIRAIGKGPAHASQVITRADMAAAGDIVADVDLPSFNGSSQPPLAHQKVRFVGEPVALAFAASRAEAEDIVETIELELDELPAFATVFSALARKDVRVHEHWDDNLVLSIDVDKNFAAHAEGAAVVVSTQADLARQCMVPLEGKAVLACWDHLAGQLVVYSSTQVPHMIRMALAQCLGIDQGIVRVIAPDVGGGFGYKCVLQQEELCVAWLALTYKTPFRYVEDRREHLVAGANSRQHHYQLTGYADARGRLLALDARILIDGGAYSVWPFSIGLEPMQATSNLPGPYDFQGYRCRTECVSTNKPGFVPYRGVARTGACLAMELLIDAIAAEVGREAWEVRFDNLIGASAMPYKTLVNRIYDSGDYPASLKKAVAGVGVERIRQRQRAGEPDGRLIGVGFATFNEQSAHGTTVFAAMGMPFVPGFEQATVRVTPDGGLEMRVGLHSHGQGMETTLAQIANEILGVPVAETRTVFGDTATTPFSTGTYASRGITMAGGAVAATCKALLPRIRKIGAHLLQQPEHLTSMERGDVVCGERRATLKEIAQAWYAHPERLPADVDTGGLEATVGYKPKVDTGAFSYATHACVVAVDPATGQVEIIDYLVVEDCGRMINPMVVEGQTYGGVAQGIGSALYEEMLYDHNAQPLNSTLADYMLPGPTELPAIRIEHMETRSANTEFGVKGVGEGGAIGPPAAILNAVNDAIRGLGATVSETPLTPERLLAALGRAEAKRGALREAA
jgi:carbon-monoxide dehydrogenase large subunit